ncbi:substrate-binding domain-containing protein [Paenibacillus sepulcri]|uniref:Helix-turn-helix transcriptional regulator n=1 Tax=Paenibacillus sepulcri TaxID=359917 RepID=A0ABS7BX37_9BACL|nr:helix-turn-helix transcriptional regulator [Paenibacillus sepulcri]
MNNDSYTTEEIAALLKISKLTVYDLIKKGKLPSYRVGRQMRVDAVDLEAYKKREKGDSFAQSTVSADHGSRSGETQYGGVKSMIITGQDASLDILAKHFEKTTKAIRPLRSYVGSLDSLIALYRGEVDLVSTHLLDGDTGEYNISYIRKILTGRPLLVINLVMRSAGIYVQKGNPKNITAWADLRKRGLSLVNREPGSGARILLDEQLRLHNILPGDLQGYETEESNHMGVAGKVALGEADVGVGIEKAAYMVAGVDFIPLITEKYDLVMLKLPQNLEWIEYLKQILRSDSFKHELKSIQGYDLSRTGEVIFET